jgi:GntR family transcriptional regulator
MWKPGDLMPTEVKLSERFSVSVGTAKQAILVLAREGMVYRQSGKGTFVSPIDRGESLARFFRFRESDSGQELHPDIQVVDFDVHPCAEEDIARKLNIRTGEKVLTLRRQMFQDGLTICLYTSHLPYALVEGIENLKLSGRALYDILEQDLGIYVVQANESLRAVAADKTSAARLCIQQGAPLIVIERTAYTYQDVVIEWRTIAGRGDKFEYQYQLR